MKYSLFNFSFFMLLVILLATHHPIVIYGHTDGFDTNGDFSRAPFIPAEVSDAMAFIGNTWRRAMVLREWLLDYDASQWEIYRAADPVENDLIQARFHVDNAEVLTEAMRQTDRAVKELTRAETSLEAIQNPAKPSVVLQLRTVENEITAAEHQPGSALSSVPFEEIKSNLEQLIQIVRSSKT